MSDAGRGHTSLSTRRKRRALGQACMSPGLPMSTRRKRRAFGQACLSPGSKETSQP